MIYQRDITFDIMKGIGILLVITCHFFGWNHHWLSLSINSFHMPMFFIIAGYFSKSFIDWQTYWLTAKKYFNRLYWPFAFTHILLVLWFTLMAITQKNSWNEVITNTLSIFWADAYGPITPWGQMNVGVVWFLIALLVAKILLIPLTKLGNWAIPFSLLLAFGSIMLHQVFPYSIWCISLGLTALPFVTFGCWLKSHKLPIWFKILAIIAYPSAIYFSGLAMYEMKWPCYPLDVLGACGGTYLLYLLSKAIAHYTCYTAKLFATLGVLSLAIMCFHNFEMSSHLTNHIIALIPVICPMWLKWILRYIITITLAVVAVQTPYIKRIFIK